MHTASYKSKRAALALLFCLFCFLAGVFLPPEAAARSEREELTQAISQFEELSKDKKRGKQREPWEKIEKTFSGIRDEAGTFAPEAHFYQARCREELADRSRRRADYQESIRLYRGMAEAYPKHLLADNAMYNRAMLLSGPLNDKKAALAVLDELILRYPDGDMQGDALRLRDRLENSLGGGAARNQAAQPPLRQTSNSSQTRPEQRPDQARQAKPAAERREQRQSTGPTRPPAIAAASKQDTDKQRKLYNSSAGSWSKLISGANPRAKYRDIWIETEKGFLGAVKAAPDGPLADKSSYQAARSREELAKRSTNRNDWREAAAMYSETAASYPDSSLADDCLYYRTRILADRLGDYAAAAEQAKYILGRYPGGDMAGKSRELLGRLEGKTGSATARPGGGQTIPGSIQAQPIAHSGLKHGGRGSIATQLGLDIKTVVVDAGHGGKDPGALGNGIKESSYTMELAKMIGLRLKKRGFDVVYTRSSDKYAELRERTSLANAKKADIFISLHVNSSTNKKLHGFEIYYLDAARSDAAALVAARENAVDVNATSDLQFILSDLTLNSKRGESLDISNIVLAQAMKNFTRNNFGIKNNGVRSAPFYVLLGARMPAFLVEAGYLSSREDTPFLKNKKYMECLADGVVDGIVAYKAKLAALRP